MTAGHDHDETSGEQQRRPLAMVLLGGLYLFFLMLTISTFGHPFPLLGRIYQGRPAEVLVFIDSMVCLYLFLGLMKNQRLTWYLLLGYNAFELINTLLNTLLISAAQLEKVVDTPIDPGSLVSNNLMVVAAIAMLSLFIYRQRPYFSNPSLYLF